jgi:hypothetical protein
MNTKHFGESNLASSRPGRTSRRKPGMSKPSLVATLAGVLCVAGVFAVLGLLYSIG